VELRPVADRLAHHGALGACLRAPMMPHQRTGRRWPLTAADGTVLHPTDPLAAALRVRLADIDLLERVARTAPATRAAVARRPGRRVSRLESRFRLSVTEVLRIELGLDVVPGRTVHCPFHDDRRPSLSIARDDRRAWCMSPPCPLYAAGRGMSSFELAQLARAARP
jgi:hypothetical protein